MDSNGKVLFSLNGNVATMTVYEDHCIISGKKTLLGLLGQRAFDGAKEFYYCDLTTIQYKEATGWINGFIQLEYPGSHSGENNFNSENTFVIMKGISDIAQCREAYEYIKSRIAYCKQMKNQPAVIALSPADEIKKYKELMDQGVLTEQEFETKKRQLLERI